MTDIQAALGIVQLSRYENLREEDARLVCSELCGALEKVLGE